MYTEQAAQMGKAIGYSERGLVNSMRDVERNPTVEENIDARIAQLKAEIANLEESKKTLGPLLPMRISDIRRAMNY